MWSLVMASPRALDREMAAGERRLAARAQIVQQPADALGRLAFLPRIVDHDHRRAIARAEAFDFEERERAAAIGLARLDLQPLADRFGDPLGAVQRARQRAADAEHEFADRPRV